MSIQTSQGATYRNSISEVGQVIKEKGNIFSLNKSNIHRNDSKDKHEKLVGGFIRNILSLLQLAREVEEVGQHRVCGDEKVHQIWPLFL